MGHVLVQRDNGIVDGLAEQVDQVTVAGGGETQTQSLSVLAECPHTIAEGHDGRGLAFRLLVQGDLHRHSR